MVRADALVVGDREDQAMHFVLQLAHVAGPAMACEEVDGLGREAPGLAALFALEPGEKPCREQRHVGGTVAQRWDADGEDAEPVVEITSEASGVRFGGERT